MSLWTTDRAQVLCVAIEQLAPRAGCHVALTGGVLYKAGARKDLDLLFYRIRQVEKIDMDLLWKQLALIGVKLLSGYGWCYKAQFYGLPIDCFFPEDGDNEYRRGQTVDPLEISR